MSTQSAQRDSEADEPVSGTITFSAGRLRDIGAAIAAMAADDGVEAIAQALLDRGMVATGASAGVLVTVSDQELEIVAFAGYSAAQLEAWSRFPMSLHVPVTHAVKLRRIVVVATATELQREYPALGELARGPQAITAFPILDGDRVLGAVALRFAIDTGIPLPGVDGDSSGLAISRAVVPALLERVAQVTGALRSRIAIEQAKGVLAERRGIPMGAAFELLRRSARSQSTSIHDIAERVVNGDLDL